MSQHQPRSQPQSISSIAFNHLAKRVQESNPTKQPRVKLSGYSILSKVKSSPSPHQGGKKGTTKKISKSKSKKRTIKK